MVLYHLMLQPLQDKSVAQPPTIDKSLPSKIKPFMMKNKIQLAQVKHNSFNKFKYLNNSQRLKKSNSLQPDKPFRSIQKQLLPLSQQNLNVLNLLNNSPLTLMHRLPFTIATIKLLGKFTPFLVMLMNLGLKKLHNIC